MNKAVFLDRDGVINERAPEGDYVIRWEDMRFLPGVAEAISLLNQAGFQVIVISNQRCVAKGLVSQAGVEALHQRMEQALRAEGARVDAIYFCPHELHLGCACRKPAPGMILEAARERQLDLNSSWMVGDSEIDIEAGKRAGCHTARLLRPHERARMDADLTGESLLDITRKLLIRK
jgi:D-glycero-D-manno-heptose 1,7-bisphosphate phosphatase